jgi:CRISPR-associated protein Csd1
MLDRVLEYGRGHGLLSEPGFKAKEVRWVVEVDAQGGFLGLVELGDPSLKNNQGRGFAFCPDLSQGELIAGGQTKSHFLVETAEVVAAWEKKALEPKAKAKMEAKHAFFVDLLERAGQEVMPELGLAARCLSEPESLQALREELDKKKVKPGDKVTFRVGGPLPWIRRPGRTGGGPSALA